MTPPTFRSNDTQPRKQLLSKGMVGKVGTGLAVVALVALIVVTLHLMQGTRSTTTSHSQQTASGSATATADQTAIATTTGSATATVSSTSGTGPKPTPSATERNDVQVAKNQNFNPQCSNGDTPTWSVQLTNVGTMTVSWQAVFPIIQNNDKPYWGTAQPDSGSLGPGQSSSFVMSQSGGLIPCGGDTYKASVHLTYPAGSWQPDLPLTYAGVGPIPMSNVKLTSGALNNKEACPASGVAPAPFTFTIQNTGDAIAYPDIYTHDDIVANLWANVSYVFNPPNPAVTTWLYPGETWTVTVSPRAGVKCDGTVYHIYLDIGDARKTYQTTTFTYTFG